MNVRKKRGDAEPKLTRLQEQCSALNFAIRKGVVIRANVKGTMRSLIGIKSGPTGITFLFHDEQDNLCMFLVAPVQEIELLTSLGSEAHE